MKAIDPPVRKPERNDWVRDALRARGFTQRDLAKAWGVAEASVSRFIAGDETVDPPLSRALVLAELLGMTIDDLAKAFGFKGAKVKPSLVPIEPGLPLLGTFSMNMTQPGTVRVVMHQDVSPDVAGQLMTLVSRA